jgi:hypothetical protein
MKIKGLAITAGALAVIAAAVLPMALKAATKSGAGSHEIAGTWKIDMKSSDMPRRGGGMGHGERPDGPPPGAVGRGPGGPDGGHRGGGMRRGLPRVLRITGSAHGYAVADSSGTIVQDISFAPVPADDDRMPPKVQGTWKGDKLVVTRTNPRGGTMTQTFEIEKGQLIVRTKMERKDGGDFEMKRVYTRTS